jgi:hypothetical protein
VLSTKRRRLVFVIWCVWAIAWIPPWIYNYRAGDNDAAVGYFIWVVAFPGILLGVWWLVTKLRAWISAGQ